MNLVSPRPVALVTGASRGIGRAIALALAEAGYAVVGASRTGKAPAAPAQRGGLHLPRL